MAYIKSKDRTIHEWMYENEENGSGIYFSIKSYDGGESKLHFGPRFYTLKNGNRKENFKVGRLSVDEVMFLSGIIGEMEAVLHVNVNGDVDKKELIIENI